MNEQKIIHGDCLEILKTMSENSIDFVVTDPPYGLSFMNKQWDKSVPGQEIWSQVLRVCKPGSMLAAFGGSRTHHHLMISLEKANWEIRDVIMWLYGSGFPKSHNHFGLEGYGTALKPAYEPIIICMKPLDGTYKQNIEKWGIGGINIDICRIPTNDDRSKKNKGPKFKIVGFKGLGEKDSESHPLGRWPANIILDEETEEMIDEKGTKGASRFFYCAKASSKERNKGLEGMPFKENMRVNAPRENEIAKHSNKMQNFHPTVKPIVLMKYIIRLLAPPNNPTLLDPFAGSGSTLIVAKELGINAIGIEINEKYCEIAKRRIANGQAD